MQFQKKTTGGSFGTILKLVIKLLLLITIFFAVVVLVDKINFPSPVKQIEKKIPNENFKIIK
tara:strand:+ start:466 stop:651 length:186 start_codon:yes stop_codon:yes gene_type:complete